jgi:spermidine synthase
VTRAWSVLERVETRGATLELRRRGERDFLILVDGRVLMSSAAHRSEQQLASEACAALAAHPYPRVLMGGLGMGFTLRAALDALPASARVRVAELHACVVAWCKGALASLTRDAVSDPRVEVAISDVAREIRRAAAAGGGERFDAILLDLYTGPGAVAGGAEPCFEPALLEATHAALAPGGVYAVWSERPDAAFERRLRAAGLSAQRSRSGRGGLRHVVYTARRAPGGAARA